MRLAIQRTPDPGAARALYHRKLMLAGFGAIIGSLILPGSFLALWRWRDYAIVLLPAYTHIAVLALSYARTRLRELSHPLLFISLAGLLWDILFGTQELGEPLSRKGKIVAAVLLVGVNVVLYAARLVEMLYRVTPVQAGRKGHNVRHRGKMELTSARTAEPTRFGSSGRTQMLPLVSCCS